MRLRIIGLGKSGANMLNEWQEYCEQSYFMNTHKAEMESLPGDFFGSGKNQIKLCLDGKGTGRSPKTGQNIAEANRETIEKFLKHSFGDYKGLTLIMCGGGGGSGTGFAPIVCDIMDKLGYFTGLIYTLPLEQEGVPTIPNALNGIDEITKTLAGSKLAPCFLIDNELLLDQEGEGQQYWDEVNQRITKIMLFAELSERKISDVSTFNTLDPREFLRMFRKIRPDGKLGFNDIKSFKLNMPDAAGSFKEAFAETSMSFVEGYDYKSASGLLVVVEQPDKHGNDSAHIGKLFAEIDRKFRGKDVLKSVVSTRRSEYTCSIMFSGLNAPMRLKKLHTLSAKLMKTGKKKRLDRAKPVQVKGFRDDSEEIDL